MPSIRRSASRWPRMASPSRLMFRRMPSVCSLAMAGPSLASVASTIRWETSSRSTLRAAGTAIGATAGASRPPRFMADFMYQGRKPGVWGARSASASAAIRWSSGRTTRSTNPTVKSSPAGSFSTPASCLAEKFEGCFRASRSQVRTCSTAAGASARNSSGSGMAAFCRWACRVSAARFAGLPGFSGFAGSAGFAGWAERSTGWDVMLSLFSLALCVTSERFRGVLFG